MFSVANKFLNVGLTFFTLVLVARTLEPDGQGKYSLLVQFSRTFFYFFSFGFPVAFVFYFGRNKEKRQGLVKTFSIIYSCLILLGGLAGYIFSYWGHDEFFSGIEISTVLVAVIGIPLWFANSYFVAIFTGLENFKQLNINQLVQPVFLFIAVVFLYYSSSLTVLTAIWSYVLSLSATLLMNMYYLKKDEFKLNFKNVKSDYSLIGSSYKYAFKTYLGSVSEFLIYKADIYIIAYFLSKSSLGLYVIAVNIVERLWMISESISKVLFAKLVNVKEEEQRNFFTITTLQGTFLISVAGAIVLMIFAKLFIDIFFGEDYAESTIFIYILLPGVILQSTALMIKKVLEARGYPGTNALASISCLILNIILNISLIPIYEVKGAAFATSVTYVIYFFIQSNSLKKKFGIKKRDFILVSYREVKHLFGTIFK